MAAVNSVVAQRCIALPNYSPTITKPKPSLQLSSAFSFSHIRIARIATAGARKSWSPAEAMVMSEEIDVTPERGGDSADQQSDGGVESGLDQPVPSTSQIGGFAFESGAAGGGVGSGGGVGLSSSTSPSGSPVEGEDQDKMVDRVINASIVLASGAFAITKLLTIDRDYWHGWTLFEILRYAPLHNWTAYEDALKTNPVFAKMMISGVVYSIGDWIAQCYAGKPLFEFDRVRMLRSGLTGFALHGSLSHYYYEICENLFPFQGWWVVPAKVAFDQTLWSAFWNSIYFVVLGLLRFEYPANIFGELKATFWPMLTAGWKLWPFAHFITYGAIPVEQRLLWVDCVELVWVMILSTYSNKKSETEMSELSVESLPAASEETK